MVIVGTDVVGGALTMILASSGGFSNKESGISKLSRVTTSFDFASGLLLDIDKATAPYESLVILTYAFTFIKPPRKIEEYYDGLRKTYLHNRQLMK